VEGQGRPTKKMQWLYLDKPVLVMNAVQNMSFKSLFRLD